MPKGRQDRRADRILQLHPLREIAVVRPRATEADRSERLIQLLKDYTSVGLTGIIDRDAPASHIDRYKKLHDAGKLPRVAISHSMGTAGRRRTFKPRSERWPNIRCARAGRICESWASRPISTAVC